MNIDMTKSDECPQALMLNKQNSIRWKTLMECDDPNARKSAAELLQDIRRTRHTDDAQSLLNEKVELQKAGELMQSDKLASIGQLAAGVAHEINNPIFFVHSNLGTLEKYHQDMLLMLQAYEKVEPLLAADAKVAASLKALREKLVIDFIKLDLTALQ